MKPQQGKEAEGIAREEQEGGKEKLSSVILFDSVAYLPGRGYTYRKWRNQSTIKFATILWSDRA